MIVKLDFLFPYYYYAHDRNEHYGLNGWLKEYGGKFNGIEDGFVEISEEDYVVLKLRFGI